MISRKQALHWSSFQKIVGPVPSLRKQTEKKTKQATVSIKNMPLTSVAWIRLVKIRQHQEKTILTFNDVRPIMTY